MSRFLLVDDEPAVRAAVRRALRAHESCNAADLAGTPSLGDLDDPRDALLALAETVRRLVNRDGEDL